VKGHCGSFRDIRDVAHDNGAARWWTGTLSRKWFLKNFTATICHSF